MPFDWREFLELARDLQGQTGSGYSAEAAERTSVSRAYYAAFCHARNYAAAHQGFRLTRTSEDHKLLREHFQRLGGGWINVEADLDELRKWRNKCDYNDSVHNLRILVQSALRGAHEVIEQCK